MEKTEFKLCQESTQRCFVSWKGLQFSLILFESIIKEQWFHQSIIDKAKSWKFPKKLWAT